jgi:hypothetical protein
MRRQKRTIVVVVAALVLLVCTMAQNGFPSEKTAAVKLSDIIMNLDVTLSTGNARAIVAAQLPIRKPASSTDQWPGNLIYPDPEELNQAVDPNTPTPDFVRVIEPGSLLVLVNLTEHPVQFTFDGYYFVEESKEFTVEADGVKILAVRKDAQVEPKELFRVEGEAFRILPGPWILIP